VLSEHTCGNYHRRPVRLAGSIAVRAVVSRVTEAAVLVDNHVVGELTRPGLLVLLGVTHDDGPAQAETMARKLHELRILRDERSVADTGAGLLVISQFTLYGATRKGRRLSFTAAAHPEHAKPYDRRGHRPSPRPRCHRGHRTLRRDDGRAQRGRRPVHRAHRRMTPV
jgi:D-aminoacyl-tRNA deacylase